MKNLRLTKIISMLETRKHVTTKEMSELLGVSSRTIRRDIDDLSYMGYPIASIRGRNGGWYLLDEFKSTLKSLTADELSILSIAPPDKVLKDLEIFADKLTLDSKLAKTYKDHSAFKEAQYVYVDSTDWFEEIRNTSYVSTLLQAIKDRMRIEVHYEKGSGDFKEYDLEGLGLVFKSNTWYLIAQTTSNLRRTFKVSRIENVQIKDSKYEYPGDFSIVHYWKAAETSFQSNASRFTAKIEIEEEHINYINKYFKITETEISSYGTATLSLIFDNETSAVRTLTGFMDLINCITPLSLREKIEAGIENLADRK
ncbi:helix-turn-helix transcriptional regulator [Salinicoccus sp. HZC-1]|uniref:helix-turn-helix transcriptional regulator n=1 Tax=Salinicoccus sp. HZC-1 TaxID=3385497 RepID=UPI00398BA46B